MASTRKRLEELTAGLSLPEEQGDAAQRSDSADTGAAEQALPQPAPVTSVETRFPPARTGQLPTPRTGPGQMLAFRGQMHAVEEELSGLRERLQKFEGAMPSRRLDPSLIRPSRWANRHEASFSTAQFAGLKDDIEKAGGNVQPILVRALKEPEGHYELVFGHRRHRACLELGIPVLASIWVDELNDADLFAAMDRENRERADLSPYEQGTMYQRALEEQLFPTQRRLAEHLGVSHTWVRKALMVAQLPQAVIECFRSPLEISHRHAELLTAALEKDGRAILKRAEKLRGQALAAGAVVTRLLDIPTGRQKAERFEIKAANATVGTATQAKDGSVAIQLSAQGLGNSSKEALAKGLLELLDRLKS